MRKERTIVDMVCDECGAVMRGDYYKFKAFAESKGGWYTVDLCEANCALNWMIKNHQGERVSG